MSTALTVSLILLILVILAAVIAITVYLVKFLIQLTILTKNLDDTTTTFKEELMPILGEFRETLANVNTIAKTANNQLATIKKITATVIGAVTIFAGKFKFLQSSFIISYFHRLSSKILWLGAPAPYTRPYH